MNDTPATGESVDVAILGGGAAGTLVAIHLLAASQGRARVALVEPRQSPGQGAAYSTPYPEHLLNVIAARMSAFDADPAHFVRYLRSIETVAHPALEHRFAQRREFGRYLRDTLTALAPSATLQVVDEALDVCGDGPFEVSLRSGRRIAARGVVLAVGNFPRSLPLAESAVTGTPRVDYAWDYAAVRSIGADADVCILGSGLSMVDAAISLAECGHRGKIHILSRHGLMPLPHARPGAQEGSIDDLLGLNVRERMRVLRKRVAMRAGEPWQWTMDRLRPHGEALWRSLSESEQARFLRHAVRYWDIHRHRIAPSVAERIDAMRVSGQLLVHCGHVNYIAGDAALCKVGFRPRHAAGNAELAVQRVLNSTGMETRLGRIPSPLLKNMAMRGKLAPGPHGIGLATNRIGALCDASGNAQRNLLTLGAMRIGACWESIAIPELRRQAQVIADALWSAMRATEPDAI